MQTADEITAEIVQSAQAMEQYVGETSHQSGSKSKMELLDKAIQIKGLQIQEVATMQKKKEASGA